MSEDGGMPRPIKMSSLFRATNHKSETADLAVHVGKHKYTHIHTHTHICKDMCTYIHMLYVCVCKKNISY